MTRRHFVRIAAIFAAQRASYDDELEADAIRALDRLAKAQADYFATQNGNFDRARFIRACGLEEA